nr:MAG TPA: zinc-ribbon domain protein [Caudoviricetes sp.]
MTEKEYKDSLISLGSIVLDEQSNGQDTPKTVEDFCYGDYLAIENLIEEHFELLGKYKELEKENKELIESLECAEFNFQSCNNDLAEIGKLVGGTCYDHTYDLVKELVDKSISKKIVIKNSEDRYIKFNIYCPTCGEMIDRSNNPYENLLEIKHCSNCGQALDWSDEQ